MLGHTLGAVNARMRSAPKLASPRRSRLVPALSRPLVAWAAAMAASVAWLLWMVAGLGIDLASLIRPGFAFAAVPLIGLAAWAFLAAGKPAPDAAAHAADGFGSVAFTLDCNLNLSSASPAFAEMFGCAAAAALGKPASLLIHPADRPAVARLLAAMLAGQEQAESLHRSRHADGQWLWIEAELRLARDAATARPAAILGMARDVTRWKRTEIRLEAANRRLAAMALEDSVTRLANRRRFDAALEQEHRRALRSGSPLSVLMIDVDRFKRFNDIHGHQAGDQCLRAIARSLQAHTQRPGDLAARYGGEEFVVVLPSTGIRGAMLMAERMRAAIEAEVMALPGCLAVASVTVSIGVAAGIPAWGQEPTGLVRDADRALYAAKAAGRNRVLAAHSPEEAMALVQAAG